MKLLVLGENQSCTNMKLLVLGKNQELYQYVIVGAWKESRVAPIFIQYDQFLSKEIDKRRGFNCTRQDTQCGSAKIKWQYVTIITMIVHIAGGR